MELDLSGEWGGHVIAREGNRIKTAALAGPASKATLRAFKNGEYLGEVAIIRKDPGTGFYWLAEMHGDEALTWIEISRPDPGEQRFLVFREIPPHLQKSDVRWFSLGGNLVSASSVTR